MTNAVAIAMTLAIVVAHASAPGSVSTPPPTIVTTKSTPYCTALARHFNGAFMPMLANDRTLDRVSLEFDDIDTLFSKVDYVTRFIRARERLASYSGLLLRTMPQIQRQIDALRNAAKVAADPSSASAARAAADELRAAYTKQRAMAIDIQGVAQSMMDYDIVNAPHPVGGISLQDSSLPPEMRDIKHYLRFDGERDIIHRSEKKAVDTAYTAATTACTK